MINKAEKQVIKSRLSYLHLINLASSTPHKLALGGYIEMHRLYLSLAREVWDADKHEQLKLMYPVIAEAEELGSLNFIQTDVIKVTN